MSHVLLHFGLQHLGSRESRTVTHVTYSTFLQVLATNGDTHLGGEDLDKRLVAHMAKLFEQRTGVALTRSDKAALARLRRECENAKRTLSTQTQARGWNERIDD